jgi:hypothetical protein
VGRSAQIQRFAVEIPPFQAERFTQTQPAVREDSYQRLIGSGRQCHRMHIRERQNSRFAPLLRGSWVAASNPNAAHPVDVRDFVSDRVFGHCRECAQDVLRTAWGAALTRQQVRDQLDRVAPPKLVKRPVAEPQSLDLNTKHLSHSTRIGPIGPRRPWVAVDPGFGERAKRLPVSSVWQFVARVDRCLRFMLAGVGTG